MPVFFVDEPKSTPTLNSPSQDRRWIAVTDSVDSSNLTQTSRLVTANVAALQEEAASRGELRVLSNWARNLTFDEREQVNAPRASKW